MVAVHTGVQESNMGYGRLAPDVERKENCSENGNKMWEKIRQQREKELDLYPLRINDKTTIYVPKEKCNDEYRQAYIEKTKLKETPVLLGAASRSYELSQMLTRERMKETKDLTLTKAAEVLGVDKKTVKSYRKKFLIN